MTHTAELVSTGAELLSGRSINTHARLLGERLGRLGITLTRDTTVQDDLASIQAALRDAATRVDTIFVSGGLGPTNDDVTRDAVADLLHRRVVMDTDSLNRLRERMIRAQRPMTPARERQALVVAGAHVWPNPVGAAPGERIQQDGKTYFLLPGPPPEFQAILDEHIVPYLAQTLGDTVALRERVLLVHGLGEGDIVHRFDQASFPPAGITTAYCAGAGRVEIRLHPATPETADALLDEAAEHVARMLGTAVYARERVELEELVARRFRERKQTLATAESCTGGLIGARLTALPGCSDFYVGGIIAYANEVKERMLRVPAALLQNEGAVSEAVARAMADGARAQAQSDYAVAVTGIAGPGGGTAEKPVGLVYLAVAGPDGTRAFRTIFPGNRETIREATCRAALRHLLDQPGM
jgi:nicotinamide-nucleotide amidase